jgi:hypothetical protein
MTKRERVKREIDGIDTDHWMAVVWKLHPDGQLDMHLETCDYPRDRFLSAVRMLLDKMHEDQAAVAGPPAFDPLPLHMGPRVRKNDVEDTEIMADDPPQTHGDGPGRPVVAAGETLARPAVEADEEARRDQAAL